MPDLHEQSVNCPYCGETIFVLIDDSLPQQNYIEDCQVCCRPIVVDVVIDAGGEILVSTRSENE